MLDIEKISNEADVILNGFAVKKEEDGFHVFNLNNAFGVAVFNDKYELIETNMDDIELEMALQDLKNCAKYIGVV